jgi:hypothetical protein
MDFLNYSLKLYRTATLEVRASWLLGVWMLLDAIQFAHAQKWLLVPAGLVVPPLCMYVHAMAHIAMVRLVGGSADRTVLSMINDQTDMRVPMTAAKQFAVGSAGPLVNIIFWLASYALLHALSQPASLLSDFLSYFMWTNFFIGIINLLACAFCDGARIWRAALWPLFGLRRAIRWTVILSFICSVALIIYGFYGLQLLLIFVGVMSLMTTIQEHQSVKAGFDPVLQIEFDSLLDRNAQSWFGRWQQRRRIRAEERKAQEVEQEQAIVDALLEKVSRAGLPALTAQERATLNRISKKQKQRDNTAS